MTDEQVDKVALALANCDMERDTFRDMARAALAAMPDAAPAQPTVQEAAKVLLDAMGPNDLIDAVVMEMLWDGSPFSALRALAGDSHD